MIPRIWLSASLLSVVAILWMGWRLLEQDRSLELEQQRQAIESAADTAAALLEKSILQAEQAMVSDSWMLASGEGAVIVRLRGNRLASAPEGQLLYSPVELEGTAQPAVFFETERQEFAERDLNLVEQRYRELANSRDAQIRAGSLVRLARVLAQRGDKQGAENCYRQLARLEDARFEQVPVPLVAHLARRNGQALAAALDHPKVLPSRDVFLFHAEQASMLTGGQWKPDAGLLGMSETVADHWPARSGAGRTSDGDVTILWRRDGGGATVLAVRAAYVLRQWCAQAEEAAAKAGCRLRIGATAPGAVTRARPATGLPWPISLERSSGSTPALFSGRRRLIAMGTLGLAAMLLATGYFTHRAVNREIAAARMQSEFVSAVSHEFRTPLTALRQFTSMLVEREGLSDTQRRTCYEAQMRSTDRLSRLVESLLDFRRMEAGARPYVRERLDAAEFSRRLSEEFQRESGAEIRLTMAGGAWIEADAGALSLALWNLLDNAVKYAPGSPIDLRVASEASGVRISVADRGPGIEPSDQRRIFDKFVRGRDAQQWGVKGTGIGLAMVKRVAEAHDGGVELKSEPGSGCVFTLVFPRAAA
jgi:signal transduction histidine kinase